MSQLYFAYGSNLWLKQIKNRCPDHKMIGRGVLKGYRWIISKREYANIIGSSNDYVEGIIYEISSRDEERLDINEGVKTGLYRKEYLNIEKDTETVKCLVYVDPTVEEGCAKSEYVNRINNGLIDANLSPEYVMRYIRKYIPVSQGEDKMSDRQPVHTT